MNEDLISRSAAKDEILSWAVIINKPHLLSKEDTLHVLDTLPAVDAEKVCEQMGLVKEAFEMAKADLVAVVRCKDCKHMTRSALAYGNCWCKAWGRIQTMGENGFCCFGERRADK